MEAQDFTSPFFHDNHNSRQKSPSLNSIPLSIATYAQSTAKPLTYLLAAAK
jgi:hypothetical protein